MVKTAFLAGKSRGSLAIGSALLAGLVAFGMAGCSNSGGSSTSTDTTNTASTSSTSPASGKKHKIAAVIMQDDQFFRLNELGMQDAARKYGADLSTASAKGAVDQESQLVDTYASQGVEAILVSPLNPKGSAPALQRAADKGIKIVTYNAMLDKPFVSCALHSDDVALGASTGKVVADFVKKKMGGHAKVAMIEFESMLADIGDYRPRGFRGEMAKVPGIQIVAKQDAWLAPDAEKVVTDVLTAHPDINIIWAANEGGTIGAVTAVKNAGKAGKVFVFGTDMSDQMGDFLLSPDNILQAVTGQKAYEMGYSTVEAALNVLDGKPVKKVTILPGVLYTRDDPAAIKAFQEKVKNLSK